MSEPDAKYHRPVTTRFEPDEAEKILVKMDGFDADLYSRFIVENTDTREWCVPLHDGYPTS